MITTTLRIDKELYNKIIELALENRRSINSHLLIIIEEYLKEKKD